MDPCVFCAIAAAEVDAELTAAVGPLYGAAGMRSVLASFARRAGRRHDG